MQTDFPKPKYFVCSLTTQAARKMVTYYNRVLAPLGLTAQQVMALGVLWREEDLSLGVFARRAGIGKAAAVSMVKRLEAMGLITRMPHPEDARLNVLRLTPKARRLAPEVAQKVNNLERTMEKALGTENLKMVIRGLSVIRDLDL
jgi:DNA-binding MarR family transcriptional regulator